MTYHQTKRTGKAHHTEEVKTMTEIYGARALNKKGYVGVYKIIDAYIRGIENGWYDKLTNRYIQVVLLSRSLDLSVEPVAVWETALKEIGLSSGSDIGGPPVWYDWKLRWVVVPQLHLEGHRT